MHANPDNGNDIINQYFIGEDRTLISNIKTQWAALSADKKIEVSQLIALVIEYESGRAVDEEQTRDVQNVGSKKGGQPSEQEQSNINQKIVRQFIVECIMESEKTCPWGTELPEKEDILTGYMQRLTIKPLSKR